MSAYARPTKSASHAAVADFFAVLAEPAGEENAMPMMLAEPSGGAIGGNPDIHPDAVLIEPAGVVNTGEAGGALAAPYDDSLAPGEPVTPRSCRREAHASRPRAPHGAPSR